MEVDRPTLDTVINVQPRYEASAWINLTAILFGYPLNALIIFIGIRCVKNGYHFTVLCMTFCQLYAVILETLLYVLYLSALKFKWDMTVLQCSAIRRILQVSTMPASFSILVLSIDRYFYLIYGYKLKKVAIIFAFVAIFIYAYVIYVPFQLLFGEIGVSDICGPALVMSRQLAYFMQPIESIVICLAFVINLRLVYFVLDQSSPKNMVARGIRRRDFPALQLAVFGLFIQVMVPFLCTLPQAINLALYNLDHSFRFSDTFWKIINFFVYFELFLNSLVTLIFVKQFRCAAIRMFRGEPASSSTIQSSSRNSKKPQYGNRPFKTSYVRPSTAPGMQVFTVVSTSRGSYSRRQRIN